MEFTLNCALTLRVLRLTYSPLQPFIVSSRNAPLLGGRPRLSLRVARLTFFFLRECTHFLSACRSRVVNKKLPTSLLGHFFH